MTRQIEPALEARIERAVEAIAERLDLDSAAAPYRDHAWDGTQLESPALHLDDFSGIPFLVDISGVEEYQHRARLRARRQDLYAASTPPTPGYEAYCQQRLGLPPPEFLQTGAETRAMYLCEACRSGAVWERVVEIAGRADGLTLHPFMGIEDVWDLAAAVAETAATRVSVLAPPPPVTWIANDKALFDELVARVLGRDWLVETRASADVERLADHLLELATSHGKVALKRLRCASAMGNAVFEAAEIENSERTRIVALVSDFLERTEWLGDEQVLAVAWEEATHSPSTQLWLPPDGSGPPRLDGVYEQLLVGARKVFMGSRPSQLPTEIDQRLGAASIAVARALQRLGYVGRCSFDLLVVGDPLGDYELKFTECNGRWGGTSTPMALLDRLFPNGRPPYRARDFVHPQLVGSSFRELLAAVGDQAWDHRSGAGRFLFYNTGPLSEFGKLDVIALGTDQSSADAALEEDLPRLWGL